MHIASRLLIINFLGELIKKFLTNIHLQVAGFFLDQNDITIKFLTQNVPIWKFHLLT